MTFTPPPFTCPPSSLAAIFLTQDSPEYSKLVQVVQLAISHLDIALCIVDTASFRVINASTVQDSVVTKSDVPVSTLVSNAISAFQVIFQNSEIST